MLLINKIFFRISGKTKAFNTIDMRWEGDHLFIRDGGKHKLKEGGNGHLTTSKKIT